MLKPINLPKNKSLDRNKLDDWLQWIEQLHPRQIELGLDRVQIVQKNLHIDRPSFVVITVAGTNGKGSTVAWLQSMLLAAGHRVGSYTSPHLQRFNERICINGKEVSDKALCQAFESINQARGDTVLTYFEFGTLAAVKIMVDAAVDVALLETGMGGRLDAVNAWDADVAVITSIGIDHTDWLGTDRESIAFEKAGIFRELKPAVCADPQPPQCIDKMAQQRHVGLHQYGREFSLDIQQDTWDWHGPDRSLTGLPHPGLAGQQQFRNAAAAIMTLQLLQARLPCSDSHIRGGLCGVVLPGRFQVISEEPLTILDVAHNAEATGQLAQTLTQYPGNGKTHAVVAMLGNKDHKAALRPLLSDVDHWYFADLCDTHAPGASATTLQQALHQLQPNAAVSTYPSVLDAYNEVCARAGQEDRIVVFGSFYTVSAILTTGH
ncbi:MAG: bifunctional tetrahydrofolate synthase/dihydrofolate synthase [Gammaproteobacteria bacterium]|nr:MAG: bifunctional tetrahydrofolate synthase/dihydrofolate synthase [Gammaproteobacteria bacterium]